MNRMTVELIEPPDELVVRWWSEVWDEKKHIWTHGPVQERVYLPAPERAYGEVRIKYSI